MLKEYANYIRNDLDLIFEDRAKYPVIQVIMPMYNHGRFLKDSIPTIIEQDYPNKLITIVDDKSTDDSLEIAKSLINIKKEVVCEKCTIWLGNIKNTPSLLISLNVNGKQWNARNVGISTCWNYIDFVCQLDCDDWFLPGKLSKSMEIMKKDTDNIGLVYGDVIIHNEINGVITHEFREPYSWERLLGECIVSNTPLINKVVFEEVGLYEDLSPCEDYWQWIKIANKFMCVHIPEPLSCYRVTPQSCTFVCKKSLWEERWKTIREKLQTL